VYFKGHKDQINLEIQRAEEEFNRVLVTLNANSERVLVSLIEQRENLVEERLAAKTHSASCYEDLTEWYEEVEDLARSSSKQAYKQSREDVKQQAEKHKARFAALVDAHVEALDHLKRRKKSWDEWLIGLCDFPDEEPDWKKESLDSITKDLNALTITKGLSMNQKTPEDTKDQEEIDIDDIDVNDLRYWSLGCEFTGHRSHNSSTIREPDTTAEPDTTTKGPEEKAEDVVKTIEKVASDG
jgi:hypothetical protein